MNASLLGRVRMLIVVSLLILISLPSVVSAEKFGWITDIHAGKEKKRKKTDKNILYPKKYKAYFRYVLKKMEKAGVDTVIVTGDNTNKGTKKHAKSLASIAKKYDLKMVWVKGNHDKDSSMQYLSKKKYYYVDRGGVRIIVLNSSSGRVDSTQIDWFKDLLADTTTPVVLAMHHPVYDYVKGGIRPEFQNVENAIRTSDKVKYVVSGHVHNARKKVYNGITYQSENPLTLKEHLGSYRVIDVK